jgi:murein DD-endopeptidase MepM/ murein hydrolase activator NlpD
MSCVLEMLRSRYWLRAAALALTAGGLAACSTDSSRFNESPFAALSNPDATGSISQSQGAPVGRVESRPLPAQNAQAPRVAAANPAAPGAAMARPGGDSKGATKTAAGWSWDGGTAVTVGPSDSIDAIARRYGVPASVIRQANNIAPAGTVYPGQRLVIPRYQQPAVAAAGAPAAAGHAGPTPTLAAAGTPGVHVVASGDTLSRISRLYRKPVNEIAKANNIEATTTLNVGDRLVIPGVQMAAVAKPAAAPAPAPAIATQPKPAPAAPAKASEPAPSANVVTPAAQETPDPEAARLAEGTGALPKFRWPANGRVIAGYGPTTNGQQNDGINIALPENTPVKAAEDGVVAYAGNELKGYGNLVLVRHPNGYVTAYAHAKELLVKRGDQVKRGQVIARSGQTGNVNAPQLHFEIRKGASPLDPTRFLNGA